MPVAPTYPGVYIEEVPSGVRTVVGVATSVAAFIDFFGRGPMDRAVHVFSYGDFEREFGGLHTLSEGSYAIQQFFVNGGSEAWVIRAGEAGTFRAASVVLRDAPGGADVLRITAGRRYRGESVEDPGAWGNRLRVDVDYETTSPATLFNLTVAEVAPASERQVLRTETYRNLTMAAGASNNAIAVVNESSVLVQLTRDAAWPLNRPAQTGTVGGALGAVPALADGDTFQVTYGAISRPVSLRITTAPATLQEVRRILQSALQAADPNDPVLAGASVELVNSQFRVLAGRAGPAFQPGIVLTFSESGGGTTGSALGLVGAGAMANVQRFALGGGLGVTGAQNGGEPGLDGNLPDATALRGVRDPDKSGLYALEDVDLFNIVCIPRVAELPATDFGAVIGEVSGYCEERRAFLIVDIPPAVDTTQEARDWVEQQATIRHRNLAVYFPRPRIADPLNGYRLRSVGASGTIAGLYARIDVARGVWKAPAGTEAVLRNVQDLDYKLTDDENGALNPLGVNCLRNFPIYGNICWGARTLEGADQLASDWKYVPVRRLALFLEESLYRGLKWVVFEPNDEPLWAQIRLNVGAFMHNLFRQGAFQGQTPREAYFVKCDRETTTQNDINLGIVNIVVGFAPLKPAEFVILKIQQMAGQIQT
jgi:uncharacterized protein